MSSKTKTFLLTLCAICLLTQSAAAQLPSFADLTEKLLPAVVNISTTTVNEDLNDETAPETEALGSGFIIDKEGYIVTNQHVIHHAKTINVILHNNEQFEAKLIGEDTKTDLALLKITSDFPLTQVEFGDSDRMRVGDWILAIGNPFGLGGSVTAGIISAKSRDIESGPYDNFIQTDAAINQGSSGGPMFNLQGEVIGINTAIFSTTGNSMGVGFATPSKLAQWVIGQLRHNGKVIRGWIGIAIQPNPLQKNGILVSRITEGSPADRAGLKAGDIISKFNKMPINNATNLSRIIAESAVGEMINLEIIRNDKPMQIRLKVEEMPEQKTEDKKTQKQEQTPSQKPLGLTVENITPELLKQFNRSENLTNGVIVTNITAGSDASLKGLQTGDIISKVDKKDVLNTQSFKEYINEAKNENNRPVLLSIQNEETEHFVAVKLRP